MRKLCTALLCATTIACSNSNTPTDNEQTTLFTASATLNSSESSPFTTGYRLGNENIEFQSNCDTEVPPGGEPYISNAFDPVNQSTYNYFKQSEIYDSEGIPHSLEIYYVKICDLTWLAYVQIDGFDVGDPLPHSFVYAELSSANLIFSPSGEMDQEASDSLHLVSNWVPRDSQGNITGAYMPLNVSDGGALPIPIPPISSNFAIDFSQVNLQALR